MAASSELRSPDRRLRLGFACHPAEQLRTWCAGFGFGTDAIQQRRALLLIPAFERIRHGIQQRQAARSGFDRACARYRAAPSAVVAASMRARTPGVSFATTSSAFMFSTICAGRLAPVMTVETFGFLRHHASDICASVHPSSAAI